MTEVHFKVYKGDLEKIKKWVESFGDKCDFLYYKDAKDPLKYFAGDAIRDANPKDLIIPKPYGCSRLVKKGEYISREINGHYGFGSYI